MWDPVRAPVENFVGRESVNYRGLTRVCSPSPSEGVRDGKVYKEMTIGLSKSFEVKEVPQKKTPLLVC